MTIWVLYHRFDEGAPVLLRAYVNEDEAQADLALVESPYGSGSYFLAAVKLVGERLAPGLTP